MGLLGAVALTAYPPPLYGLLVFWALLGFLDLKWAYRLSKKGVKRQKLS
jgi:hypothetical protein